MYFGGTNTRFTQIEGTHVTLSDIYAFEVGQEALIDEDRRQSTQGVVNYLHALTHGLDGITTDDPITVELLCEMHDRSLRVSVGMKPIQKNSARPRTSSAVRHISRTPGTFSPTGRRSHPS